MTRAERAAFIRGLEAARRLAEKEARLFRADALPDHGAGAISVMYVIHNRIRREREKGRAK